MTDAKMTKHIAQLMLNNRDEKEFFRIRVAAHARHYRAEADDRGNLPEENMALEEAAAVRLGITQDVRRKLSAGMPATQQPYTAMLHAALENLEYPTIANYIIAACTAQES